jgi:ubiquinone/menaquinone biosynthesis C-methylase UbiE
MSSTEVARFDAAAYKRTTRDQWQVAAEAWSAWEPQLEQWLGEATELMLGIASVRAGDRVLDLAAGAGGQTIAAARRAGPRGAVLATDISPAILEYAAAAARHAGLANVATQEADGENLEIEPASFDAVISRLGLIYFPDQAAALAGIFRALKPGGRVASIVYSTPDRNRFFSVPVSIIRRRANLAPPLHGQPGPFSLGAEGVLKGAYERAGFREVDVRTVDAPLRLASAAECTRFERESFGALHQMLSGLSAEEREEAWAEIEQALSEFEGPDGFAGPCELIVAAGTR